MAIVCDPILIWIKLEALIQSKFDPNFEQTKKNTHTLWYDFWIRIYNSENFNDDMWQRIKWGILRRDRRMSEKILGEMFHLYAKNTENAINLLHTVLCMRIIGLKAQWFLLCDGIERIERFIQRRKDFLFDKMNKITPPTHKSP